jgi:L-ribulokinase
MASAFADTVCVAGLDFGTDSVRCLLVDVHDGHEVAAAVANYPRWKKGDYSASAENRYRQHPLDYLEALQQAVSQAMVACPDAQVRAVCVDTTGSTPAPVTRLGQPLALLDEFVDDPDAMFFLWKDHTAIAEAGEITTAAREWAESGKGPDPTAWSGGAYSSEWFWAKMLGATRRNSRVAAAAHAWVEHCDWITGELTGTTAPESMLRSRCAAGHKAMWSEHHGGLPPADFLHGLDPRLVPMRQRMNGETWSSNVVAGPLSREWAKQLGWPEGIPVAVGLLDAHAAAVGAGIRPGSLVRVMGTSTCDMLLAHPDILADRQIGGISGQVVGSIIPGYVGLEAGQAAFGDVLAWFGRLLMWSGAGGNPAADLRQVLARLGEAAAQLPPEQPELALDWFNGRRSPNPDQSVKAAICGLTLGSDATRIYRALVESVAFGSRSIVEHFRANELAIDEVIAVGGVAHASDFVVQVLADVLEIPIKVPDIAHPSALGAAVFAAVAAGLHPNVEAAQRAMLEGRAIRTITPHSGNSAIYRNRYSRYLELASREEAASR